MYTFTNTGLCIKDLDLIKQITVKDFEYFCDHLVLISKESEPFMGGNLFSLRGNEWRNMRGTLSPAFTGSKMRAMFVLMAECAENFAKHFYDKTTDSIINDVELKDILTKYTNDVIASAAFGIKCDSLADDNNIFYKMGRSLTQMGTWIFIKFGLYTALPSLMNFLKVRIFPKDTVAFFHNIVMETIKKREKENIYRPDMIQLLMEARNGRLKYERDVDKDTGFATVEESTLTSQENLVKKQLADSDITPQALIFFFAGFDASSTSMGFMILELALNPDVQEKLYKEIVETMEAYDGKLSYEAVVKMKYLDQVVSGNIIQLFKFPFLFFLTVESLRKWTPGFQADRACVKKYTFDPLKPGEQPLTILEGTQVFIPIRAIHLDPKFFPNPDKFDPDRFSDENKHTIISGSYMPFGVGPRNCIGIIALHYKFQFIN